MDSKEKYALLTKHGLCHRCEKAAVFPGRKFCAECLEKISEYNARRYNSEKAREYQPRRRELYQQKKISGICVRCTKKATHGIYCYECSIKAKRNSAKTAERRKRERHERGLIPEMRKQKGLCLRCGKNLDVENSLLCAACCETNRINSALADKTAWRQWEQWRYEKNRQWREKHDKQ
ncbi:hypothetical protein [Bacteroides congonensis]|uniref:hypothetical protein n=1 Tax=Bacteroides congonensis TaxID=1871006 RepID=UPI00265F3942|nr:hypothetical protein [Bacteroides congonensis]